jgi:hypothetical protein
VFFNFFLRNLIMNANIAKTAISSIVLALAALGSAGSFAASVQKGTEGETVWAPALTSNKTRAEVQAEYFQAVKSGQIVAMTEGAVLVAPEFMSIRSRDDLHTEAVMAASHPLNTGTL